MNQIYVTKDEQREVAGILKGLSRDDRIRIEGMIAGYRAARETAQPPVISATPQPTTT